MRRGFGPGAFAAIGVAVLVVAVIGWNVGWAAAGTELQKRAKAQATSVSSVPPTTPSSPKASSSPKPQASSTSLAPGNFAMPDLRNLDFREARKKAIELNLGVNVRFDQSGGDAKSEKVVETNPTRGTIVHAGITISLLVSGPPPEFKVPDVTGKSCDRAKEILLDAGMKIDQYPSGQGGIALKTNPSAGSNVKWNDKVDIFCLPSASNAPATQ